MNKPKWIVSRREECSSRKGMWTLHILTLYVLLREVHFRLCSSWRRQRLKINCEQLNYLSALAVHLCIGVPFDMCIWYCSSVCITSTFSEEREQSKYLQNHQPATLKKIHLTRLAKRNASCQWRKFWSRVAAESPLLHVVSRHHLLSPHQKGYTKSQAG